MDRIHEVDKKPWISKRTLNLKETIEERTRQLHEGGIELDLDDDQFDVQETKLRDELGKFAKANEKVVKPYFLFNSTTEKALVDHPECQLKIFRLQLEHAKRMISDRAYKVNYLMDLRTTRRELLMRHLAISSRTASDSGTVVQIDRTNQIAAVVVVQIWPQPSKTHKIRLEKEIHFRSDQCLTDLRDQFKCQRDYGVPMDLSNNPKQAERIYRGELFKSGFFLIGDTFYNDMRDQNNIDLSLAIMDWASREVIVIGNEGENIKVSRGIGPFNRANMEDKTFEDLNFRLGCPYFYLHQGDCEHIFTISDIKYLPKDGAFQSTRFPFVTATSIGRKEDNLRCYMCCNRSPHWYTRNNSRLPVDPYFFCENCFYSFNYDKDDKKIGTFQAYLYTSAIGIPDSVNMVTNKQS